MMPAQRCPGSHVETMRSSASRRGSSLCCVGLWASAQQAAAAVIVVALAVSSTARASELVPLACQAEAGVEFVGGNLFPKTSPNHTSGAADCCALCQRQRGCEIFTWSASCWGNQSGCCWLKAKQGAVRQSNPASWSGTPSGAPLPGRRFRCVDTECVADPSGPFADDGCNTTCEAGVVDDDDDNGGGGRLLPPKFVALPIGAVSPTGWFGRQLTVQLRGLSGHLGRFWPDVANSTYSDRGGNLPYWLNGVIPLVFQMREQADRVDSTPQGNLTDFVVTYMRTLLANQLAVSPPPMHAWWSLGTWNVVRSILLYLSALPQEAPRFTPFLLGYIEAAHARLAATGWPDGGTACTQCDVRHPDCAVVVPGSASHCVVRYPDWMWVLQELHDAPFLAGNATARDLIMRHMRLVGEWGTDFIQAYANPCDSTTNRTNLPNCFPKTGCNHMRAAGGCKGYAPPPDQYTSLFAHGVSGVAMPLKEGAVRWRMTGRQDHWELSDVKLSLLDRYHGQPTGGFSADEFLAGRHPSRGVELCTIVETVYSLEVMHLVQGGVAHADRAERIAFNALPGALTADMWGHNYLSTINEIQAARSNPHLFGDSENATIYGLADQFTGVTPCCTANHNQGWPKLAMSTVTVTAGPNPAAVVSLFAPVVATLPEAVAGKGATVGVLTDYPFGDTVTVTLSRASRPARLLIRVPGWADRATVAVNGGSPTAAAPMRFFEVACAAGDTTAVLVLNPALRVETGWGEAGSDGAVVSRGALLFALELDEKTELLHPPWACFDSGCSTDVAVRSTRPWNYALVLPPGRAGGRPSASAMAFERVGAPGAVPFASGNASVRVVAAARRVASWTMDPSFPMSAAHPLQSPVDCVGAGSKGGKGGEGGEPACGDVVNVTLVPFGATRLRVGVFPWTGS